VPVSSMVETLRQTSRQLVVVASSSVLQRLGRESRVARLAGLAAPDQDFDPSKRVVGVECAELGLSCCQYVENRAEVDQEALAQRLSPLFVNPNKLQVSVVLVFGRSTSLASQVRDLINIASAARQLVQQRELESPRWQLIAIAESPLTVADFDELERLRALRSCDRGEKESWLFDACLLCDWKLANSPTAQPVFSRHVWPILVGRRLVDAALWNDGGPTMRDPWYRAWASAAVVAPLQEPMYEDALLAIMNLAIESKPIVSVPMSRDPKQWIQPKLEADRTPARTVAKRVDSTGYFKNDPSSPQLELGDFLQLGAGNAVGEYRRFCDPNSMAWRAVQETRSIQFRIDHDRFQCAPFDGAEKPSDIQQRLWRDVRHERGLLDHYAGAQALARTDLLKSLGEAHKRWEGVLDFDQSLAEYLLLAKQLAELHDKTRAGFLAWWCRVTIAAAVSLFVGFVLTSFVATASGNLTFGVFVAASVVAVSAIGTTLVLWSRERAAGRRGIELLERELREIEASIDRSLRYRLDLLRHSAWFRSQSIWMSMSARVRTLSMRVRHALEMVREEVFVSTRALTAFAGVDGEKSLQAFSTACEYALGSDDPARLRLFVDHLQQSPRDPNTAIAEFIEARRGEVARAWEAYCVQEDRNYAGHFTVEAIRRTFLPIMGEVRSDVERTCTDELCKSFEEVDVQLEEQLRLLGNDRASPPLLSVCTDGSLVESTRLPWRVLLYAKMNHTSDRIVTQTREELAGWGSTLLLAHIEWPLELTAHEGVLRIQTHRADGLHGSSREARS